MKNLTGTEKQVSWATEIMQSAIERLQTRIDRLEGKESKATLVEQMKERLAFLETIEISGFVIEYRDGLAHFDEVYTESLRADYQTWK